MLDRLPKVRSELAAAEAIFCRSINPDLFHHEKTDPNFSGEIKTEESSLKKRLRIFCVFRLPICCSNFLLFLFLAFVAVDSCSACDIGYGIGAIFYVLL